MQVEYNGFDETGSLGNDIFFIRVGLDRKNYFRAYIYNILHFGELIINKYDLKRKPVKQKNKYLRSILNDPVINVDNYVLPKENQVHILRSLMLRDMKKLFEFRKDLIAAFLWEKEEFINSLKVGGFPEFKNIPDFMSHLRNYENPHLYLEWFIKSYSYRMIFPHLAQTSRILRNPHITSDYKVISFIDGGRPFCFWYDSFLRNSRRDSKFDIAKTPIFGISNGDEYFPVVMMAGNIATLWKSHFYPQGLRQVPMWKKDFDFESFYNEFVKSLYPPKYFNRVLFIGQIPKELQYSIPMILHREDYYYNIYEPFRIHHTTKGSSINSFERKMGKITGNDIIISGRILTRQDRKVWEEFIERGLDEKSQHIMEYQDKFNTFLDILQGQTEITNLDNNYKEKIMKRTDRIRKQMNDFFEKIK
ncbi:hypothetical protein [Candidatus Pyrohabitans sp.]